MAQYIPEGFPEELLEESLLIRKYENIINICLDKNSRIYSICKQPNFWERKINYDLIIYKNKREYDKNNSFVDNFFFESCLKGRIIYVSLLLQNNKDKISPNSVSEIIDDYSIKLKNSSNNAISWAVSGGHLNIVKLLLDNNFDPSWNNNYFIQLAVKEGHSNIVKLLILDKRVDPSTHNNNAILMAVIYSQTQDTKKQKEYKKIIKLLLDDNRVISKLSKKDIREYKHII